MLTDLYVPLVTPFDRDGEVALDAVESLAHEVLAAGAAGLVALGTTGEPATLTASERMEVVDVCARVCRERGAGLIVGAGGNDTAAAMAELAELRRWPQAQAALVPVPYYTLPPEAGVIAHFTRLAATSPVPIVVYNIPYRTGRRITAEGLLRLAEVPGIVGVKQSVGGVDADTVRLITQAPPGFSVLCGDDPVAPAMLALGAPGAIVASAHVSTEDYGALVAAWRAGDVERARWAGGRVEALSAAMFVEPNPMVVKGVLHAQGRIPTDLLRAPMTAAAAESVRAALAAVPERAAPAPSA